MGRHGSDYKKLLRLRMITIETIFDTLPAIEKSRSTGALDARNYRY